MVKPTQSAATRSSLAIISSYLLPRTSTTRSPLTQCARWLRRTSQTRTERWPRSYRKLRRLSRPRATQRIELPQYKRPRVGAVVAGCPASEPLRPFLRRDDEAIDRAFANCNSRAIQRQFARAGSGPEGASVQEGHIAQRPHRAANGAPAVAAR